MTDDGPVIISPGIYMISWLISWLTPDWSMGQSSFIDHVTVTMSHARQHWHFLAANRNELSQCKRVLSGVGVYCQRASVFVFFYSLFFSTLIGCHIFLFTSYLSCLVVLYAIGLYRLRKPLYQSRGLGISFDSLRILGIVWYFMHYVLMSCTASWSLYSHVLNLWCYPWEIDR